ncbi:MAG: membrane protein insertase YidC [Deltaproteobacteria bacterium]|nr:membrane protein insertase YidC [Deltaproteobacteria bacterium]
MSSELRMLLAIVLSFLVFFLYQVVFVKPPPTPTEQATGQKEVVQAQSGVADEGVKPIEPVVEGASPLPGMPVTTPLREGRTITVSTPLYVAAFTENGAAPKSFKLREYREALPLDSPMQELISLPDGYPSTLKVSFLGQGVAGLNEAVFDAETDRDSIEVPREGDRLTFTWTSPEGITITRIYTFLPETYEIGHEIKVQNRSAQSIDKNLTISLMNALGDAANARYVFVGPTAFIDGELREIKTDDIEEEGKQTGLIKWVSFQDRYFASAIVPQEARNAAMNIVMTPSGVVQTSYIDPSGPVPPGTERTYQYKVYLGPKRLKSLGVVGADLTKIVDFGFFDMIAKPFLHMMNFLNRFIPNYGIVIIIITIIVKMLFWPLSNKSYQSMSQMKKLQPKMAEIRAKYKHDKKMMNQEIMNLYKLYKINPLGGCLPMVFQIPVFFAFYKMLYQAIELRHAPFFLWIDDLSAPDRLFDFGFTVPMMTPPYGIPVLTIIMGASMFFQQKMSPPPGDPTQAKMMMFMPIFFTFIFINFPSGLVLYWLVNNILSMVQQKYVTQKTG